MFYFSYKVSDKVILILLTAVSDDKDYNDEEDWEKLLLFICFTS